MKDSTENVGLNILVWLSVLLLPWSLAWWLGGAVFWLIKARIPAFSQGRMIFSGWRVYFLLVASSPFMLPLLIYCRLWRLPATAAECAWMTARAMDILRQDKPAWRAARWIARRLKRQGIIVLQLGVSYGRVRVRAQVGRQQFDAYRRAYAEAVRRFADRLGQAQICSQAEPLAPLDKQWAEFHGFRGYAAETSIDFCALCGQSKSEYSWLGGSAWDEGSFEADGPAADDDQFIYVCPACLGRHGHQPGDSKR